MNEHKHTWVVVGVSVAAILTLLLFVLFVDPDGHKDFYDSIDANDSFIEERTEGIELDKVSCEESGGVWNACGSACRSNPADVCIELCVEYCECQSDDQCPSGYTCGEFVDDIGVCL